MKKLQTPDFVKLPEIINGNNVKATVLTSAKLLGDACREPSSKLKTIKNIAHALSKKITYDHTTLDKRKAGEKVEPISLYDLATKKTGICRQFAEFFDLTCRTQKIHPIQMLIQYEDKKTKEKGFHLANAIIDKNKKLQVIDISSMVHCLEDDFKFLQAPDHYCVTPLKEYIDLFEERGYNLDINCMSEYTTDSADKLYDKINTANIHWCENGEELLDSYAKNGPKQPSKTNIVTNTIIKSK